MARIPSGFWQGNLPPPLPSIQLAQHLSIHLDRDIIERDGMKIKLTPQQVKFLFILIEKRRVSPGGIVPTWYLVDQVLSEPSEMADPEHAIEEIASKIRQKLGEEKRFPRFIVCIHGIGYKLCADEGFGAIVP